MDACNRGAAVEADAIGEQQLKRTQLLGNSNRNQEAGAIGEQQPKSGAWRNRRAAAEHEADTSGEQQLKRGRNRGAAALHRELSAPDYSRRRTS